MSPTAEVVDATATNPLTHRPAGTITQLVYPDGATMTINNASVAHAAVWETSGKSSSQVMALYGTFGTGRFAAVGDSSPFDDGTSDPGDTLYDGCDEGSGDNGHLITNASLWLLAGVVPSMTTQAASGVTPTTATLNASVNPAGHKPPPPIFARWRPAPQAPPTGLTSPSKPRCRRPPAPPARLGG